MTKTTSPTTITLPEGWNAFTAPRSDLEHIAPEFLHPTRTLCGLDVKGDTWGVSVSRSPLAVAEVCPKCLARWGGEDQPRRYRVKSRAALEDYYEDPSPQKGWFNQIFGQDFGQDNEPVYRYFYVAFRGQAYLIHDLVPLAVAEAGGCDLALKTDRGLILWSDALYVWSQQAPLAPTVRP